MRKMLAFLAAFWVVSSVSALDISVGGMLDYTFHGLSVKQDSLKTSSSQSAIGVKAFADIQYATVFIGGTFDVGKMKTKVSMDSESMSGDVDMQVNFMTIGVLGKYPFTISNMAKIYPLAGFEFDFALSAKMGGEKIPSEYFKEVRRDLHRYWFDLGVGSDIAITDHLLIRPQAMFGIQMNSGKAAEMLGEMLGGKKDGVKAFGYKINVGLGVGYKF